MKLYARIKKRSSKPFTTDKVSTRRANGTRPSQIQHNTTRKQVKVRYGIITIIDATNYCHNLFPAMAIKACLASYQGLFLSSNHPVRTLHPPKDPPLYTARGSNDKQTIISEKKRKQKTEFNALLPHGPFRCKRINCLQRPASGPALLFNPSVADVFFYCKQSPMFPLSSNQKHITPKGARHPNKRLAPALANSRKNKRK